MDGEGPEAGVETPEGISQLRETELRGAAQLLGVSEVTLLDFRDSGMDGEATPGTLCGAPLQEVETALQRVLGRVGPDIVVTLDGGDGHRDHRRIRAAVESVLAETPTPVYLHTLPRSLMHRWVRHHAGDADATSYTELPDIGTPDDQITTVLDTHEHRALRDAAIAVHRSQRSPFADLPEELRAAFLEREHLIRIQ